MVEWLVLKPHQKNQLISTYIILHFLHTTVLVKEPVITACRLDQQLQRAMKNIFHLPQCMASGLLYCKRSDGRFGIPKTETTAVTLSLKTGYKFLTSNDSNKSSDTGMPAGRKATRQHKVSMDWPI
jgi:hypothetical protein